MIVGIGFDPVLVIGGAAAQHLLVHRRNADDLTKEVHHLLGPRQGAQITVNDNAIEAVINKNQEIAEQLDEGVFHNWESRRRARTPATASASVRNTGAKPSVAEPLRDPARSDAAFRP